MGDGRNKQIKRIRLELIGPFRLSKADGTAISITSKRSKAIIAILATSKNMEKTRIWLQNTLWCDRSKAQSQASLRRELSNLKTALSLEAPEMIWSNNEMIGIKSESISVDLLEKERITVNQNSILEGFDLPNEDNFETWLRDLRCSLSDSNNISLAQLRDKHSREGMPSLSIWPDISELSEDGEIVVSGIIDTLFENLPKLKWLDLINSPWRNSSNLQYSDDDIANMLSVKYLLKCRCIEKVKTKNIHFKLLKMDKRKVVWTEVIPVEWPLTGEELTGLIQQVVSRIQNSIENSEQLISTEFELPDLNVNSLVWRAKWHMKRLSKSDAELAVEAIELAIHRSPNDKEVLLQKAFIEGWNAWVKTGSRDQIKKIRAMVHKVRDMDPYDARPYLLNGVIETWLRNHSSSASLLKKSLDLNPCISETYGNLGGCYNYWGRPLEAIEPLEIALRLSPLGMENFFQLTELALAHFMIEKFDDAVEFCDEALAIRPSYPYAHALKVACFYYGEEKLNYMKSMDHFGETCPNFRSSVFEWLPFEDRGWVRKITRPLAKPYY